MKIRVGKQQESNGKPAQVDEFAARTKGRLILISQAIFVGISLALLLPAILTYAYYVESQVLNDNISDFQDGSMYLTTPSGSGGVEGVQLVAMGLSDEPYGWVTETVASTSGADYQTMPNGNYWSDAMAIVLPSYEIDSVTTPPRILFVGGYENTSATTSGNEYSNKVYTSSIIASNTTAITKSVFSNSLSDWVSQSATIPLPGHASDGIAGGTLVLYEKNNTTSYLYLIGGYFYSSTMAATFSSGYVYSATVEHATGKVSGWSRLIRPVLCQDTEDTPGLAFPSAIIDNGTIYVVGGKSYPDANFSPATCDPNSNQYRCYPGYVFTATVVSSSGDLEAEPPCDNAWSYINDAFPVSITGTLTVGAYQGAAVKFEGATSTTVYYIGGVYYDVATDEKAAIGREVFFGDIDSAGRYISFTKSLSGAIQGSGVYGHGAANTREQLVFIGGSNKFGGDSTLTKTVQAALTDEGDASTRLLDFCEDSDGNPIPGCQFTSRWLANEVTFMPRRLYAHSLVEWNGQYFLLGGDYPGGGTQDYHSNRIYHGTVNGEGSYYAPYGYYTSKSFDARDWTQPDPKYMRRLEWEVSVPSIISAGLQMSYRVGADSAGLQSASWTNMPVSLQTGDHTYSYTFTQPITVSDKPLFQYRGYFTSSYPYKSTALLKKVTMYYYLDDPDFSVSKTANTDEVSPGDTVTFTVRITNPIPVELPVRITDTLPDFVYIDSSDNPEGWGGGLNTPGGVVSKTINATYGQTTLEYRAIVESPIGSPHTPITNTVVVTFNGAITDKVGARAVDPNTADNTSRLPLKLLAIGLDIGKKGPGDGVVPGEEVQYTIVVTGTGTSADSGPVRNVVINDYLPANSRYQACTVAGAASGSCSGDQATGVATWTLTSLVYPQQPVSVTLTVKLVKPITDSTVLTNTAKATSYQLAKPVYATYTHSVSSAPDLSISKSADPTSGSKVPKGSQIKYTLQISNPGTFPAQNVVVTDALRSDVSILTYTLPNPAWHCQIETGNILNCNLNYLGLSAGDAGWGVSGTEQVEFKALADAPLDTVVSNKAYAYADDVSVKTSNEVTHTIVSPNLSISKDSSPSPGSDAPRNSIITYTIRYTNSSGSTFNGVLITDVLSSLVTFQSCTGSCNTTSYPGKVVWSLGLLDAGGSGSFTLRVKVNGTAPASSQIENNCAMWGQPSTDDPVSAQCTTVIHPILKPYLMMSKDSEPPPGSEVVNNSPIKYNINHWNNQGGSALNTIITDVITGPVSVDLSSNTGWNLASLSSVNGITVTVLTYSLGTYYGSGNPASPTVLYAINKDTQGSQIITNTAYVYSPDQPSDQCLAGIGEGETNTVTHTTFYCSIPLSSVPDLEFTDWSYTGGSGPNNCVFTDTALTFRVTVKNNGGVDALATYSNSNYKGFSTELHAVHETTSTANLLPLIPSKHYFGFCPDDDTNSLCNLQQQDEYGRPDYYKNTDYTTNTDLLNGGLRASHSTSLSIKPAVQATLPITGWWTIYIHPDKYWKHVSGTRGENWGFILEGTGSGSESEYCWEKNNVRSFKVRVRSYSEKTVGNGCAYSSIGGVYLPIILKSTVP